MSPGAPSGRLTCPPSAVAGPLAWQVPCFSHSRLLSIWWHQSWEARRGDGIPRRPSGLGSCESCLRTQRQSPVPPAPDPAAIVTALQPAWSPAPALLGQEPTTSRVQRVPKGQPFPRGSSGVWEPRGPSLRGPLLWPQSRPAQEQRRSRPASEPPSACPSGSCQPVCLALIRLDCPPARAGRSSGRLSRSLPPVLAFQRTPVSKAQP